jgi:hypothetical protein
MAKKKGAGSADGSVKGRGAIQYPARGPDLSYNSGSAQYSAGAVSAAAAAADSGGNGWLNFSPSPTSFAATAHLGWDADATADHSNDSKVPTFVVFIFQFRKYRIENVQCLMR